LGGSFVILACLGFAGCAYGADADGVGLGGSSIETGDAAPDALSSGDSGQSPDAAKEDDSSTPPDDSSTPTDDAIDPFDTSRPEPDSSSTCTLTLPTGIPACDSCLETSCCSADDACGSDPSCMMFDECISECEGTPGPDAGPPSADAGACITACETEYPTGASELENLDSCLEGSCATACGAL
jgi:hypothetical protein